MFWGTNWGFLGEFSVSFLYKIKFWRYKNMLKNIIFFILGAIVSLFLYACIIISKRTDEYEQYIDRKEEKNK